MEAKGKGGKRKLGGISVEGVNISGKKIGPIYSQMKG
jgi:hypothetical protein